MIIDEEKDFFISPEGIKKQVLTKTNKEHLVFKKTYKNELVEKMKLPLFVPFLMNMIYDRNKIPSFKEFFDEYCNSCPKNIEDILISLKLRLSRAYVSVVRELYVRCFFKEKGFNIKYNFKDDTEHDVDMWVEKGNDFIAVAMYQDTEYSRTNRKHKLNKRLQSITYYDFGYDLDNTNISDCVYFPYEKDINNLMEELSE